MLAVVLVLIVIAFAALTRNSIRVMFAPTRDAPVDIAVPIPVAGALVAGVALTVVLGVTIGPLAVLFDAAGTQFGVR